MSLGIMELDVECREEPSLENNPWRNHSRRSLAAVDDRLAKMLRKELDSLPDTDYIERVQVDGMRPVWRSRVASWLLEFEEEFDVTQDTIAVAVNFMDRYLSQVSTKKSILQLVALGSIFVASKLHEAIPLRIDELREMADGAFQESDIKLMELELLRVISWKLHPVTPQAIMTHLVQFVECGEARRVVHDDAVAFLDVALPEYDFIQYPPSVQATAAVLCAFETSGIPDISWCGLVQRFGVLDHPLLLECKEMMLTSFYSLCPPVVEPVKPINDNHSVILKQRTRLTPSPTGVDELIMEYDAYDGPAQFTPY